MFAIVASATIIGMTLSFSFPLASLVLEREGVTTALIGLNAAMSGLAIFAIAPWLPRIIGRLGAVGSMAAGQLLCMACLLLMPLRIDLVLWAGLRFLLGLGMVLSWVASETAINALATETSRGRVIGLYATLFCIGYAAGPALIVATGTEGFLPFVVGAGVLALGLPPLLLARGVDRAMAERGSSNLLLIWRVAPIALGAILVFGLVENASFSFLPLYGLSLGYDEAGAALLLTLLILGNILLQLPLGWLADRISRRTVLTGCAAAALAGLLLWPVALAHPLYGFPLLLACGGALGGLYTVSLTLLGERFRGTDLAVANTAFAMMYEVGAIAGPLAGGVAMETLGPGGLPLTLTLAIGLFLALALLRAKAEPVPAGGGTRQGGA